MIIHIALYKFKQEFSAEQVNEAIQEVRDLKDKISQIIEIYAGQNTSKWSKDYTHAIVSKFKDKEDLDSYRNHPAHKPIADKLDRMEEDSIGVDFETI